jgi:TonB-dependent receptor
VTNFKQHQAVARPGMKSFVGGLLSGASALAFAAVGFVAPAHAQATDPAGAEDEEVVVTGLRNSLRSAQGIKRDADVIVDSITAVDIGALPDRSVAEALQRIPGITLGRTNSNRDPVRLTSEGGDVFVRGLSFVRSETNGRDIFSATNGRGLSFEDISSDLLAGVDVYKSPSADLIEGGIGGTVNLRTRLPFDAAGQVVAGSVDYTSGDLLDESFASFNMLYSNRWDTGHGSEMGVLFSYSKAETGNRTDTVSQGGNGGFARRVLTSAVDGLAIGTEVWVPGGGIGWRSVENRQERESYYAAFQVAPTAELTFTLQALYAKSTPTDYERAAGFEGGYNENDASNNYNVVQGRNVLVGGVLTNPPIGLNNRSGRGDRSTGDYSINFRYTPDGPWTISGDLQYIESTADFVSMSVGTAMDFQAPRPDLTFDLSGDDPFVSLANPAAQANKAGYTWAWGMDHLEDNDADEWAGRLDAEYAFADDSFFRSFRFGVRATQRESVTRQTGYNWALLSAASWGGSAPSCVPNGPADYVYLTDTGFCGGPGVNADLPNQVELYGFDDFFHGDAPPPSSGWFATEALVSTPEHANTYLRFAQSAGWGWVPLVPPGAYEGIDPRQDNALGGINRQLEDTNAFYGVLRFGGDEHEVFGIPFDGNIGVRVVTTTDTSRGRLSVGGVPAAGTCLGSPVCLAAQAFAADARTFVDYENEYTNTLPSLNLRFHLSDDLQLRLGASNALVRPNFSQMTPFASLNFAFQGTVLDPNNSFPLTGTAGNPALEPTIADQLDASVEWYFAPTGSLSLAVFHKAIEDYVVVAPQDQTYTSGGETFTFRVGQQTNASDGTLQGFELAYTQFFDFLPGPLSGFGVQANYTYIDNEGGANTAQNAFDPNQVNGAGGILPLEGMSPTSYNITGMYEKYGVSARLAYNWRERYLVTTSAANHNVPEWWEDYGQLDGSIFYAINDHLKIGLQGQNLLGSRTYLQISSAPNAFVTQTNFTPRHQWSDTDTRYTVSLRANF